MALDNNTGRNWIDKTTIKNWFKRGLKPTQEQFWSTWDSFWHKDEKLPISSIDKLGDLLDGKAEVNHTHDIYAKNDATSLSDENIISWQQALGVDDLDYVEIPTDDATSESHPYVVVINDKGESAKRNATDFGKVDTIDGIEADENKDVKLGAVRKSDSNVVNSGFELTSENGSVAMSFSDDGYLYFKGNVTYQMTAGEVVDIKQGYGLISNTDYTTIDPTNKLIYAQRKYVDAMQIKPTNWTHAQHRFSGIPKVSDATYNLFPVFDNNRNLAYAENPYQMLKNGLGVMTQAQALELGQLLGGGTGSAGAMSVNLISPPIVQNRYDSVEYIYLRGANLKLNSASRKIEIINTTTNQVVLTIPNNQIVSESDIELTFWYNFKDFPLGDYKIRLTSGAKVYTTDWQLKIVQSVTDVDFNNLTWDIKTKDGYTQNTSTSASGGSLLAVASTGSETTFPVLSLKSSELFVQGEDFYIELQCNITVAGGFYGLQKHVFGIGYADGANENLYLMNVGLNYTNYSGNINVGTNYTSNNVSYIAGTPYANTVIIIKTGNLFRVISRGSQESITLSNNSGYSIFAQMPASPVNNSLSVRIVKAFKLN